MDTYGTPDSTIRQNSIKLQLEKTNRLIQEELERDNDMQFTLDV